MGAAVGADVGPPGPTNTGARPALGVKDCSTASVQKARSIRPLLRASVGVAVFPASGLDPGNVGEAVRRARPFGLNLSGGLRTRGHLDVVKGAAFMRGACVAEAAECEEGLGA